MAKLIIKTPHGDFTRTSNSPYQWAIVRRSPRAAAIFAKAEAGDTSVLWGSYARWVKDRGYIVTWHGSQDAAAKAASTPCRADLRAEVVGIFSVEAQ